MIYHPRPYEIGELPREVSEIHYKTSQGKQVSFLFQPKKRVGKLWVLFNGNGSLALHWLDFVFSFPSEDQAFLLFEYPGYGYSEGNSSPKAILESSTIALEQAKKRLELEEIPVSVMGHSLGAAAAVLFANAVPVEKVILLSPFTSMLDMARRSVGFPFCHLLRHRYNNLQGIRDLLSQRMPPKISLIHGTRDRVVPVEMSRSLKTLGTDRISLREFRNADHNDILPHAEQHLIQLIRD